MKERDERYSDSSKNQLGEGLSKEAFQALFLEYFDALSAYACRIAGGAAEDVVQDVFFSLWERRDTLIYEFPLSTAEGEPEKAGLRAYLYRAVRNRALSAAERSSRVRQWTQEQTKERQAAQRAHPKAAPDRVGHPPDADLARQELAARAKQAVEALPPRRREVYRLSRYEGLSNEEVATVMGIARSTVEVQMWHALRSIRDHLDEMLPVEWR